MKKHSETPPRTRTQSALFWLVALPFLFIVGGTACLILAAALLDAESTPADRVGR